jgi:hypothetical protein
LANPSFDRLGRWDKITLFGKAKQDFITNEHKDSFKLFPIRCGSAGKAVSVCHSE